MLKEEQEVHLKRIELDEKMFKQTIKKQCVELAGMLKPQQTEQLIKASKEIYAFITTD